MIIPKSERLQRCRLWGTMGRSSLSLLGSRLLRLKPSPSFSSKATRWVEMHATPSLAAQILEWGALRGEVRERVELLRAPWAARWGVVGGGADGKCRIAETGNFPYSPAFFHTTSSSLPPLLHRFSHFICLLWFVSCGQIPELFLRSEKGSAAKPVCWH